MTGSRESTLQVEDLQELLLPALALPGSDGRGVQGHDAMGKRGPVLFCALLLRYLGADSVSWRLLKTLQQPSKDGSTRLESRQRGLEGSVCPRGAGGGRASRFRRGAAPHRVLDKQGSSGLAYGLGTSEEAGDQAVVVEDVAAPRHGGHSAIHEVGHAYRAGGLSELRELLFSELPMPHAWDLVQELVHELVFHLSKVPLELIMVLVCPLEKQVACRKSPLVSYIVVRL